jgi:hypothetical protein
LNTLLAHPHKFTAIPVPALVIFANPHSQGAWVDENTDPSVRAAAKAYSTALEALTDRQKKSVEDGVPTAHVITMPGANHYVFLSDEAGVLKRNRCVYCRFALAVRVCKAAKPVFS